MAVSLSEMFPSYNHDRLFPRPLPKPCPRLPTQLPPILTIPNELLVDIFTVHCHADWTVQGRLPFLLVLSCVNQRFRSVVLNTPSLWRSVGHLMSRPPDALHNILKRSEPFTFDIVFKIGTRMRLLFPFLSHLHRCRRLKVQADYAVPAYQTLSILRHECAPLIEELDVEVETDRSLAHLPTLPLLSCGAPLLSKIALRQICLSTFDLPFSNITTLELRMSEHSDRIPFVRFREALVSSSHLTHLVLTNIRLESGAPRHSIELPSLRSIDFTQWSELSLRTASTICAPALQSLALRIKERGHLRAAFNSFSRFSTPPIHPMVCFLQLELGYPVWLLQRALGLDEQDYWSRSILDCYPSLVKFSIMQNLVCQICGQRFEALPIICDNHLGSVTDLHELFMTVTNPSRPMCRYCAVLWNGI
jgi:hypothetical protein